MGRHAKQKAGACLFQPIEQALAARQIMHHQLTAARESGNQRAEPEIVAQRA